MGEERSRDYFSLDSVSGNLTIRRFVAKVSVCIDALKTQDRKGQLPHNRVSPESRRSLRHFRQRLVRNGTRSEGYSPLSLTITPVKSIIFFYHFEL